MSFDALSQLPGEYGSVLDTPNARSCPRFLRWITRIRGQLTSMQNSTQNSQVTKVTTFSFSRTLVQGGRQSKGPRLRFLSFSPVVHEGGTAAGKSGGRVAELIALFSWFFHQPGTVHREIIQRVLQASVLETLLCTRTEFTERNTASRVKAKRNTLWLSRRPQNALEQRRCRVSMSFRFRCRKIGSSIFNVFSTRPSLERRG